MTVKPLAPGIYDANGELHIILEELAHHLQLPVHWLEQNLERIIREILTEMGTGPDDVDYSETDAPPPWRGQG